jgi:hypothetical protein
MATLRAAQNRAAPPGDVTRRDKTPLSSANTSAVAVAAVAAAAGPTAPVAASIG